MTWNLAVALVIVFCAGYNLYRNNWVYHFRMRYLRHCRDKSRSLDEMIEMYERLPSYNHMLYLQPFKWDYSEYINEET